MLSLVLSNKSGANTPPPPKELHLPPTRRVGGVVINLGRSGGTPKCVLQSRVRECRQQGRRRGEETVERLWRGCRDEDADEGAARAPGGRSVGVGEVKDCGWAMRGRGFENGAVDG